MIQTEFLRIRENQPPSLVELSNLSDEELMASLKSGYSDALTVLFDRYHRLVLSVALRIVRDQGEAEDVMQIVFLDVFRAAAQFNPAKGTTKIWILQYAYHRSINRRQQLTARNFYQEGDGHGLKSVWPADISVLGNFALPELTLLLKQGLKTITARQQRVIEMASYDGRSMKEIAAITGDSLPNVRHHYYRGLQKLHAFITSAPKANSGSA